MGGRYCNGRARLGRSFVPPESEKPARIAPAGLVLVPVFPGCQPFGKVVCLDSAGNRSARLSCYLIRLGCRPASSVLAHSRQSVWAQKAKSPPRSLWRAMFGVTPACQQATGALIRYQVR